MYQQYDEFSMRILNGWKVEGKAKSSVSTTRTSIRKFREYMQAKELQYSPEIAAEWLNKEIRPISSHAVYKRIRFVHYSLIETAKANAINVYDYLWYCLSEAPRCKAKADWEALLPWNMDNEKIQQMGALCSSATPAPFRIDLYILRGAN